MEGTKESASDEERKEALQFLGFCWFCLGSMGILRTVLIEDNRRIAKV
jgi:hypothetical protein